MKKFTTIMLGLSLALGTVAFAQDADKKMDDTKKSDKKSKKGKKKKSDDASTTDKKM